MYEWNWKCLAILAGLGLVGCQTLSANRTSMKPPAMEVAPAAPVRAEDITVENAHDKLRALQLELEQESQKYQTEEK